MNKTRHNCVKIKEYNYAHQGSTISFALLVDLIPPEELDAIAEEESYDPNDEIDNHEYM